MRSNSRRAQSDCRTLPLHTHDDVAQPNRLSKAPVEDGCATRGTFASGCDGRDEKTRDCSTSLSRVNLVRRDGPPRQRTWRTVDLTRIMPNYCVFKDVIFWPNLGPARRLLFRVRAGAREVRDLLRLRCSAR